MPQVRDLKDELARQPSLQNQIPAQFRNTASSLHLRALCRCLKTRPFFTDGFGDLSDDVGGRKWQLIEVLGQANIHTRLNVYTATTCSSVSHTTVIKAKDGTCPYGQPRFIEEFRNIIRTIENGQFRLNLDYFVTMQKVSR
jgi:hypothetical protein